MTLVPTGAIRLLTLKLLLWATSHCMNNCKNLPKTVQEDSWKFLGCSYVKEGTVSVQQHPADGFTMAFFI